MQSHTVTKPMKGEWANTESPPSGEVPDGCVGFIETTQEGRGTHIGRFTGTGSTCVRQADQRDDPPIWDHEPAPPYLVAVDFVAENVWVASNGDELWVRSGASLFVQSLKTGAATVRADLEILGGTGRFAGASGVLVVTGGREAGEPGDHLRFDGEITLQAGTR